jgi:hypothetical protein
MSKQLTQAAPAGAQTLPKKEAAAHLGCKPRTLDRRWEEWGLTKVHVDGKYGVETHYLVAELDRVRESQAPVAVGRPRGTTEAGKALAIAPALPPVLLELFRPVALELRAAADSWPVWLTKAQALELSGLAPTWFAAGVKAGELPHAGAGRARRYHRDAVRSFADQVRVPAYLERLLASRAASTHTRAKPAAPRRAKKATKKGRR